MIITCPHCQTKYQVTVAAIGSAGRKVQCAQCHQAWQQQPVADLDEPLDPIGEDALDEALMAEAAAVPPAAVKLPEPEPKPAAPVNAAVIKKQQADFSRRQSVMISRLPLARLRRTARVLGLVVLAGMLAGGYLARVPIVERYPDMAGLYEALGLGVNVVGLEFAELETLQSLSGGNDVLTVSAQLVGRSPEPVAVPPVVVSLLDESGKPVYEWSVEPRVRDLMAGERATFDTRLSLPPSEAARVRLSFAGHGVAAAGQGEATPTETHAGETQPAEAHSAEPVAPEAAHAEPAHETASHEAAPVAAAHH
jgi:predicted Zn finger-like uncharacterized protein